LPVQPGTYNRSEQDISLVLSPDDLFDEADRSYLPTPEFSDQSEEWFSCWALQCCAAGANKPMQNGAQTLSLDSACAKIPSQDGGQFSDSWTEVALLEGLLVQDLQDAGIVGADGHWFQSNIISGMTDTHAERAKRVPLAPMWQPAEQCSELTSYADFEPITVIALQSGLVQYQPPLVPAEPVVAATHYERASSSVQKLAIDTLVPPAPCFRSQSCLHPQSANSCEKCEVVTAPCRAQEEFTAAQELQSLSKRKTRRAGGKRHGLWCHVFLDPSMLQPGFDLGSKIIGKRGCHTGKIFASTDTKVRLRGKGSGHLEKATGREGPVPLMIALASEHDDHEKFRSAFSMLVSLLTDITERFENFARSRGLSSKGEGSCDKRFWIGEVSQRTRECLGELAAHML